MLTITIEDYAKRCSVLEIPALAEAMDQRLWGNPIPMKWFMDLPDDEFFDSMSACSWALRIVRKDQIKKSEELIARVAMHIARIFEKEYKYTYPDNKYFDYVMGLASRKLSNNKERVYSDSCLDGIDLGMQRTLNKKELKFATNCAVNTAAGKEIMGKRWTEVDGFYSFYRYFRRFSNIEGIFRWMINQWT